MTNDMEKAGCLMTTGLQLGTWSHHAETEHDLTDHTTPEPCGDARRGQSDVTPTHWRFGSRQESQQCL